MPHCECARLWIEWSGLEPWPGSLCCVLRQDTLLSQCFSSPMCTDGYQQICWRQSCNGLVSHLGGCSNTPSCFMLRKPELSASPMGHLGLYKGFTLLFYYCFESQIKLYLLVLFILLVIEKGSDTRVSNYKVQD